MNKRLGTVLLFALIVSAGASALLYRMVANKVGAPVPAVVHVNKVVVAVRPLDVGTLLKASDVRLADWPGPMPAGVLQNVNDAVDRGVVAAIYQDEPIVEKRLAPKGGGGGLAATIPQGMRAVAVRVNEVVGVSGFVLPGMRVDVVIDGNPPGGAGGNVSKIILQDIEVLSAGQNFQRDTEGKPVSVPVVNLLVTPEQAEKLTLASNDTRIQLVLRNPMDKSVTDTRGVDLAGLFTGAAPGPVARASRPGLITLKRADNLAPQKPATTVVEVIEGGKRSEVRVDAGE